MDNILNKLLEILKLNVRVRIYHILTHIQGKNVDLKNGFLRFFSGDLLKSNELCLISMSQMIMEIFFFSRGSMSQVVGLPNNSYKPITNTAQVLARLCKLQKGCTRLAAASDKVYQLLAHGRWLSPGTPASSTTKTSRHDIAEILLKVTLNIKNQIKSFFRYYYITSCCTRS